MVSVEEEITISCPFCGEEFSTLLDCSAGIKQSFVYDCEVCCRPIEVRLTVGSSGITDIEFGRE